LEQLTAMDSRDSAYLELRRDWCFGPAGADLLTAVVGSVVGMWRAAPSYPNLDECWEWTRGDLEEAVNAFLDHLASSSKLNTLYVEATDGATLERGLRIRCKSWLQDRSKATDAGAFFRKLKTALARGRDLGQVVSVDAPEGDAWRRPSDPDAVYHGDESLLLEAAIATDVAPLHYAESSRRDPVTDWGGVMAVVLAVLAEAAMAVLTTTLHRISMHRFGIDTRDDEPLVGLEAHTLDLDVVLVEMRAADVIAGLEPEEVRILAARSVGGVQAVMNLLGKQKSVAEAATKRAREHLRALLAEDIADDRAFARTVAERVLHLVRMRTFAHGSSSEHGGGDACLEPTTRPPRSWCCTRVAALVRTSACMCAPVSAARASSQLSPLPMRRRVCPTTALTPTWQA
jgi:hypothetical protein